MFTVFSISLHMLLLDKVIYTTLMSFLKYIKNNKHSIKNDSEVIYLLT